MEESDDVPAFAVRSDSVSKEDDVKLSEELRHQEDILQEEDKQHQEETDDASSPAIEDTKDLLGFGESAALSESSAAAAATAIPSDDPFDLFSAPPTTTSLTTAAASAVDPFSDFLTPSNKVQQPDDTNSDLLLTGSGDSLNGSGNDVPAPEAATSISDDLDFFSSSPLDPATATEASTKELQRLTEELSLAKSCLEESRLEATKQAEQIGSLQIELANSSSTKAIHNGNEQRLLDQLSQLQRDLDEKATLVQMLQQELKVAAETASSEPTPDSASNGADKEELERLHQELEQAQDQLRQQQATLETELQRAEDTRLQQSTDLQRQLDEANRRVEGLKTDQARNRELQSLWSTEQAKRVEAETRAESAECTVDELRKLLDQQGNDLRLMHEKAATAKKEADEAIRAAEERNKSLEDLSQQQSDDLAKLQEAASAIASAEPSDAVVEVRQLKLELETKSVELERTLGELVSIREQNAQQEKDFHLLKAAHDEQHRKEVALTNRLNAAKKIEAEKSNRAEQLEDELKAVKEDLEVHKLELKNSQIDKDQIENTLEKLKKSSQAKLADAEAALKDERALNEERKKKMKAFVETKADELRQLQADNDALQSEVATTSKSLVDLNNRWKQLHAQWVQSQTRNRELQRDLNRVKKDSEDLHKAGDSIQMKLSRSTNETEEHKHKRLAAKHELMTVLRTLEAERELTNRLRDNIKYTFTPKALSQQQLIREALEEFETQLLKLAQRLSVPLPPTSGPLTPIDVSEGVSDNNGGTASLDEDVAKLDHETQQVSQRIMSLSDNVERLRVILEMGGSRSCASVLTELLTTGGMQSSPAIAADRAPITGSRMNAVRSHRYGHVPGGSSS